MTGKVPRWDDREAVAAWIDQYFEDMYRRAIERGRSADAALDGEALARKKFEQAERRAIDAAKVGNFRLLDKLLDPESILSKWRRRYRLLWSEEIENLFRNKLSVRRQKEKEKSGPRSRMREEFTPEKTAKEMAAEEFVIIQELLRANYPREDDHRPRALELAAGRANKPVPIFLTDDDLDRYMSDHPRKQRPL